MCNFAGVQPTSHTLALRPCRGVCTRTPRSVCRTLQFHASHVRRQLLMEALSCIGLSCHVLQSSSPTGLMRATRSTALAYPSGLGRTTTSTTLSSSACESLAQGRTAICVEWLIPVLLNDCQFIALREHVYPSRRAHLKLKEIAEQHPHFKQPTASSPHPLPHTHMQQQQSHRPNLPRRKASADQLVHHVVGYIYANMLRAV